MIRRSTIAVVLAVLALSAYGSAEAQADFTRFVAIGDSLTAGHTNVSLVETTQRNSVPALIHRQAGAPGPFAQPLTSPPGFSLEVIDGIPTGGLAISFNAEGLPCNPFAIGLSSLEPGVRLVDPPYDNLGVPGSRSVDVRNTESGRYFDYVLAGLGTQLDQALDKEPTFVMLWIGANDTLRALGSGIVIDDVTLTTPETFAAEFGAVVDALDAAGAQLAIGNLGNVTSVPFGTTIAPFVPDPVTCGPVLIEGQPVPLLGPDGPLGSGDLVLLPAASKIAAGIGIPLPFGTGEPLGDEDVISAAELAQIEARTVELNAIIAAKAAEVGAALVDMGAFLADLTANGVSLGGVEYTTDFLLGGIFSLDGFHPSGIGYALVANEFIEAINETFNDDIPYVDLYPFVFGGESEPPLVGIEEAFLAVTPDAAVSMRAALGITPKGLDEIKRQKAAAQLTEERRRRRGVLDPHGAQLTMREAPERDAARPGARKRRTRSPRP